MRICDLYELIYLEVKLAQAEIVNSTQLRSFRPCHLIQRYSHQEPQPFLLHNNWRISAD